jgi:conjugal transfer mating pair stabilization protein TraG
MSTLKGTDAATDALLDFIAQPESGGNYNAVIGNSKARDDLSALTIADIYKLQGRLVSSGQPSSAVGRYQFLRSTLTGLIASEHIAGTDRFTPAMQDRLAIRLMVGRGYSAWWLGRISDEEFAHRLSCEWASLPDPEHDGKSHFDGVGKNHAAYTLAEVYAALARVRALIPSEPEPVPSPDPTIDPALIAEAVEVLGRLQAALMTLQKGQSQ